MQSVFNACSGYRLAQFQTFKMLKFRLPFSCWSWIFVQLWSAILRSAYSRSAIFRAPAALSGHPT